MIISISGIDGSGKTSLIKQLAEINGFTFTIPQHASAFVCFPENLVAWYTRGNIDDVVLMDLEAFARRNASIVGHPNVLLDRGYQNVIDSACARYQDRLAISYEEALNRVILLNEKVGFEKIEHAAILFEFPFDWTRTSEILQKRSGSLSTQYLDYLSVLYENLKSHRDRYDLWLDATSPIDENLQRIITRFG